MNSLKDHVRKAHPTINHFLTYADNYAVGYFKKQGFTKEISLDRSKWVGYIKDYEGGTIMQCTMLPVVRYMEVHQMLADQKAVSDTAPETARLTHAEANSRLCWRKSVRYRGVMWSDQVCRYSESERKGRRSN